MDMDSPGNAERSNASTPEGFNNQETSIDLMITHDQDLITANYTVSQLSSESASESMCAGTSPTNQHAASELPTLLPRDRPSTQLIDTEQRPIYLQ